MGQPQIDSFPGVREAADAWSVVLEVASMALDEVAHAMWASVHAGAVSSLPLWDPDADRRVVPLRRLRDERGEARAGRVDRAQNKGENRRVWTRGR